MVGRRVTGAAWLALAALAVACGDGGVRQGTTSPITATAPSATTTAEPATTAPATTVPPTSSTVAATTEPSTSAVPSTAAPVAVEQPAPVPGATETPPPPTTAFLPVPAVSPGTEAGAFGAFDRTVGAATIARGALTLGISIAYQGQIVHEAAYGLADPISGELPTPTSRFRIASISKVLLANVVMELVQEGTVSLDETPLAGLGFGIGDARMEQVTVRHLLSHTSGFPVDERLYFRGRATDWRDAAAQALGAPLENTPGDLFHYSNTNFVLLALLVEQRTGVPFDQAIQQRVLGPVGDTGDRLAGTFDVQPGEVVHPSTAGRNYMEALGPAGAWLATPSDLVRVVTGMQNGTLVTPETLSTMRTPVPTVWPANPAATSSYGLGLRMWPDGSWGHTGTVEHAKAIVIVRPDGWTVAVTVNGEVPSRTDDLVGIIDEALRAMG